MTAWAGLQQAALADLHPGWLVTLEEDLVIALSREPQGRRWLARALPAGFQVIDQLPAEWGDDEVVASRRWLLASLRGDPRLLRVAGAVRALPWIRRQLHRDVVLIVDRVLGRELYGMLLAVREEWTLPSEALERLDEAAGSADSLASALDELGRRELIGYGNGLHAAVADRLRLALGPGLEAVAGETTTAKAIDTVAAGMNWEQAA